MKFLHLSMHKFYTLTTTGELGLSNLLSNALKLSFEQFCTSLLSGSFDDILSIYERLLVGSRVGFDGREVTVCSFVSVVSELFGCSCSSLKELSR